MPRLGTQALRRRSDVYRGSIWLLLALCSNPAVAQTATGGMTGFFPDPEELVRNRHAIEVVIFAHTTLGPDSAREDLARPEIAPLPWQAIRLQQDASWQDQAITANTRACLTFPTLTLRPPETEARPAPPPQIDPQLAPHPWLDLMRAAADVERERRGDDFRLIEPSALTLQGLAQRLKRAPETRLLWHGAWIQPAIEHGNGQPIVIASAEGDATQGLFGALTVTEGRFLHFLADLQMREPAPGAGFVRLTERRTMRLGELNYLDHPWLGVIVQITRAAPPARLDPAIAAWRTAAGGEG